MPRACVVGAGPAGLIATRTLTAAGVDVDCIELSSGVGGTWRIDNPNERSPAYRSLETNTTKAMSRLSDFKMPEDWPDFPGHARVLEWFESYVEHFGFGDRIELSSEVCEATPLEPGGWRVVVRGPDGEQSERRYDALLAASGSYWSPRMPEFPGSLEGQVLHAQAYRGPEVPCSTRGKRVVVVGIGNTGCELSCEIADAEADAVFLSARSGAWILPKRRDGRPAAEGAPMMNPSDPVAPALRLLPEGLRQRLFEAMTARIFARMMGERMQRLQQLGLPPPPPGPFDKRPTVCDPILAALESGAVVAKPAIERLDGKQVVFVDGSRVDADLVLCATGYHLRYPYLPADLVDTRDDDLKLFLGTMHPTRHDLFVLGVSRPTGAFWPIAEVQARFVASLLGGRYALPRQRGIERRSRLLFGGPPVNPALYALAIDEELRRGARRLARR